MEKNRSSKVLAIVALLVAVVGLSLGFAAFSNTLTISSSANVKPDSDTFNVDFSSSGTVLETNDVVATTSPTTVIATPGKIDNTSAPKITGLSAEFNAPGQSATYSFYATNQGEYDAFLKSITFENATGGTTHKVCTAGDDTTDDLVQEACKGITLSVKVGAENATTGSVAAITGHKLDINGFEPIIVTIDYAQDAARADGDFSVAFGDVVLLYSSVD